MEYIIDKGTSIKEINPDNIDSALRDWLVLGE